MSGVRKSDHPERRKVEMTEYACKCPAENAQQLTKRPVAFRVPRANDDGLTLSKTEWRIFTDEGEARVEADALMTDYQGLYVRDGWSAPDRPLSSEIEIVGWAILQALHESVENAPQSWSDMAGDQEKRIKRAAIAAIEAVTDLSQYKTQGFALRATPEVKMTRISGHQRARELVERYSHRIGAVHVERALIEEIATEIDLAELKAIPHRTDIEQILRDHFWTGRPGEIEAIELAQKAFAALFQQLMGIDRQDLEPLMTANPKARYDILRGRFGRG